MSSPLRPWAPTARLWMVAFDLSDPKVRRRLERLLKTFGFQANQYSLRLAVLTPGEVHRISNALLAYPTEDFHLMLLPLGLNPPSPQVWGKPLGMSQCAWNEVPGHPPCLHVGYPDAG